MGCWVDGLMVWWVGGLIALSWVSFSNVWGSFGLPFGGHFGTILAPRWPPGRSGEALGRSWALLGPSWALPGDPDKIR